MKSVWEMMRSSFKKLRFKELEYVKLPRSVADMIKELPDPPYDFRPRIRRIKAEAMDIYRTWRIELAG